MNKAAIVEFIHSSTLVHDDVVDNDEVRREMPSLWKVFDKLPYSGPEEFKPKNLAMLLGDGMLSKALILIKNPEVLKAVAESIYSVANGAIKESKNHIKDFVTSNGEEEDEYLKTIRMKTGSLFALSTHLGSMTDDVNKELKELSRRSGMVLGIIYQMADDLADEDLVLSKKRTKNLLINYTNEFMDIVKKFPENEHRKILEEVPTYVVNKMMEQDNQNLRLARSGKKFQWNQI